MSKETKETKLTLASTAAGVGGAASPDFAGGSIFFVGTATVILRYAGFTILTDPNFLHAGDHVHLGYGLTSERLTNPAIELEELPPIDFCVLSHYHGDHFDRIVEERLQKDLPIITTEHAAENLKEKGFTAPVALDTWDSVLVERGGTSVRITSMPGKHGPTAVDFFLPPVMGSMLEFQNAAGQRTTLRLYITGDTLVHDDLNEIPKRYPDIDLALFHLGGTRIMGILLTMDAEQGVEAIRIINPREVIPIHYNDYGVFQSPLEDFKRAVEAAGFSERVKYLSHGETYDFEVPASRLA
jgi:L-ascorbate metabolism protein UlaG (beta-lactamase superfamily)